MSVPLLRAVAWGDPDAPLLVVGPSLGTSAEALWGPAAELLAGHFHVVAWDLPGHGHTPRADAGFTMAELARAVVDLVDRSVGQGAGFAYAGVSVGGVVGLQLLADHPGRVGAAALICTGARIGDEAGWHDRAAKVRESGTPVMAEHSARVWFAPQFLERQPDRGAALLHALQSADAEGYAQVCEALAEADLRGQLARIDTPVLTIAGAADTSTPPEMLAAIALGVADGRAEVLAGVAHLAPAEAPSEVAALIRRHIEGAQRQRDVFRAGMSVRRQVLGDAHVDRATASITDLTEDFQELITRYAWGTIWTRPGLDRRSRSLITITALVALGHHEELAMHLRAALRNGVTRDEIVETLLQSAIYCGVPAANTAFRIAQDVLSE